MTRETINSFYTIIPELENTMQNSRRTENLTNVSLNQNHDDFLEDTELLRDDI